VRNLLIVNADDWGIDEPTTEAALLCFDAGAVTSVSAMVFMAGSQAGSRLALARGVPAGLHINLTEPFNAAADGAARARQARIAEYFAGPARRRWGPNSRLFAEIERAIGEQFEEFHRLYGREPTHVDGHEHIHQSLGVLAARTIPSGTRMRPSFTYQPGEKSWPNRSVRALLNHALRTRFTAPRYFFSIRDMHPTLGGTGLEEKLALAGGSSVEVMTHPGWEDERAILLDPEWVDLLSSRRVGCYSDLEAPGRGLARLRRAAASGLGERRP
jgi:predicted glycoside hydrolase/deacetylase ChbG (UPF0249 family)